jgi:hypothetical protein
MGDIPAPAGEEVVDAENLIAGGDQPLAEMGANKPRPPVTRTRFAVKLNLAVPAGARHVPRQIHLPFRPMGGKPDETPVHFAREIQRNRIQGGVRHPAQPFPFCRSERLQPDKASFHPGSYLIIAP